MSDARLNWGESIRKHCISRKNQQTEKYGVTNKSCSYWFTFKKWLTFPGRLLWQGHLKDSYGWSHLDSLMIELTKISLQLQVLFFCLHSMLKWHKPADGCYGDVVCLFIFAHCCFWVAVKTANKQRQDLNLSTFLCRVSVTCFCRNRSYHPTQEVLHADKKYFFFFTL